jgi:flagellar hook protein FlgE
MVAVDTNNQPVPVTFNPPTISFDSLGKLQLPTNSQLSVTINDSSGAQTMTVDLSPTSQLTDAGAFTVQNIEQDGFLADRLQDVYFNRTGVLVGSYSNGEVRNLY